MKPTLNDFIKYLKEMYMTRNTIRNYICQVELYLKDNPMLFHYNNKQHEKAMVKFLETRNNTSSKAVLFHLYRWLSKYRFLSNFKLKYRRMLMQKARKYSKKAIAVNTLDNIISLCKIPYKLIFKIQYDSGSRITEVLNLEHEDVSFEEELPCVWIKVLKTNGTLIKKNYLTPQTGTILKDYIDKSKHKTGKLFNRKYGMCNLILKKKTIEAGLPRLAERISTHWIRSTRANYVYNIDKDILAVKKMLGHMNIKSTQIYIDESGATSKDIILHQIGDKK